MVEGIDDCEHLPFSGMVVGLHGAKVLTIICHGLPPLFSFYQQHTSQCMIRGIYMYLKIQFWIYQIHQG